MKIFSKYFIVILLALFVGASFGSTWIQSHSMEPTLGYGDLRFDLPTFSDPQVGDIIDFYCPERCGEKKLIQHRLTAIDPNGCMHIQGDNIDAKSYDTRDYGCLLPSDIKVFAKTYPIKTLW